MSENTPKRAGDLIRSPFKENLLVVVSDMDIPESPDKESVRLHTNDIQPREKEWDITPEVLVEEIQLAITDTHHTSYNSTTGELSLNLAAVGPSPGTNSVAVGAAKTNITFDMLNNGGLHTGCELLFTPGAATISIVGAIWYPGDRTAEQVRNLIHSFLVTNSQPPLPFIMQTCFAYGMVNQQHSVMAKIPTTAVPSPAGQLIELSTIPLVSITSGTKHFSFLEKVATDLSVGVGSLGTDNTTKDINAISFADHQLPDTYRLYYYIITMDAGSGYLPTVIRPLVDQGLPEYAVAGTKFAAAGGTDTDWGNLFPEPLAAPIGITVTQAVFPPNVVLSQILRTKIDPSYVAPYPAEPYGVTLGNNRRVIVDNLTSGSEAFSVVLSSGDLAALDTTITGLQTQITQNATDIETANNATDAQFIALNSAIDQTLVAAGETVVFVSTNDILSTAEFDPETTFTTLNDAYNYLVTLPPYVKKRIVIDDRYEGNTPTNTGGRGQFDRIYAFIGNNITLSTYKAYCGVFMDNPHSGNLPVLEMQFQCDGLRLDRCEALFRGSYSGTNEVMFTLSGAVFDPVKNAASDNFHIGDHCVVGMMSSEGPAPGFGGTVRVGHDSTVVWYFDGHGVSGLEMPVTFLKASGSTLYLAGYLPDDPSGSKAVRVITPSDSYPITEADAIVGRVEINHTTNIPNDVITGLTVIRNIADFGTQYSQFGQNLIDLIDGSYFIVGEVYMGSTILSRDSVGSGTVRFYGYGKSKLIGTDMCLVQSVQSTFNFHSKGVDYQYGLAVSSAAFIFNTSAQIDIRDIEVDTPVIFNILSAGLFRVKGMRIASNGSGTRFSLGSINAGLLDIDGVEGSVSGDVSPLRFFVNSTGRYRIQRFRPSLPTINFVGFLELRNANDLPVDDGYERVFVHDSFPVCSHYSGAHWQLFCDFVDNANPPIPYDHHYNGSIVTDSSRSFVLTKAAGQVTLFAATEAPAAIPVTQTKGRNFPSATLSTGYSGSRTAPFMINIRGKIAITTGSDSVVTLSVVRGGPLSTSNAQVVVDTVDLTLVNGVQETFELTGLATLYPNDGVTLLALSTNGVTIDLTDVILKINEA